MKYRISKIVLFVSYIFILLSCNQKKDVLDAIWSVDYCNVESILDNFEKLGFKNTGKRVERKITNSMFCHVQKNSPSLCFIYFWESDSVCITEDNQNLVLDSLEKHFGQQSGYKSLNSKNVPSLSEVLLPYWESEDYFIFLIDEYKLFGYTECFENYGVIIQIKDF